MHALEVIIVRNARAAGREAAHAVNDGDHEKARAIAAHFTPLLNPPPDPGYLRKRAERLAFIRAYGRGRREG